MGTDDILDKFNLIGRVQGLLWSLTSYLPHRKSHKGRKVGKWRVDGGVREIHIDRMQNTGGEAERVLERAHIPIAGRRITDKEAIFLVRARQAKWAELVLLRAGVALGPGHRMIDPANVKYAAGKGAVPLWGQAGASLTDAYGKELARPRKTQDKMPQQGKLGRALRGLNKLMEEE